MGGRIERSSAWDGGQDDATSTSEVQPQSVWDRPPERRYGDAMAGFVSPWLWDGAGGIRRAQRIRCPWWSRRGSTPKLFCRDVAHRSRRGFPSRW